MGNKVSQLDNFSGPRYRWQDPHIVRMVGDRLKKNQSGLTLPVDLKQKKKRIFKIWTMYENFTSDRSR